MKRMAVLLAAAYTLACGAETFEFEFWPPDEELKDVRVMSFHEGPCGTVAKAKVSTMPQYSKAEPLAPERVFEVGVNGESISLWHIPVNAIVVGIAQSRVAFAYGGKTYSVGTDNSISQEDELPNLGELEVKPTCEPSRFFGESAYSQCWIFRDRLSQKRRTLVYETPCT